MKQTYRFGFGLAAMALILALVDSSAGRFTVINPNNDPRYAATWQFRRFSHWDLRQFNGCAIPYVFYNGTDDLPRTTEFDQVDLAFQSWQNVGPAVINFFRTTPPIGATPPRSPGILDKYNVVGWDTIEAGGGDDVGEVPYPDVPYDTTDVDTGYVPGGDPDYDPLDVLAVTTTWTNRSSGRIIESDITFNSEWTWVIGVHADILGEYDVQSVAAHEVGHFIGIGHETATDPGPGALPNPADGRCPTMWRNIGPFDGTDFERTLEQNDQDAANFLYNPDLGDAPERAAPPTFTTMIHREASSDSLCGIPKLKRQGLGPEHLYGIKPAVFQEVGGQFRSRFFYESIGTNFNGECDPFLVNIDAFDDGVTYPPAMNRNGFYIVQIMVCTYKDIYGGFHVYNNATPLYLNLWIDWNGNQEFGDVANEIIVAGFKVPPPPMAPGGVPPWCQMLNANINVPANAWLGPVYLRARIDWGENCGGAKDIDQTLNVAPIPSPYGACQFGEVEDHPIIVREDPLAVELLSFSASAGDGEVVLQWATGSETDNERFELERDGSLIGTVEGAGTTATRREYSYRDGSLVNGVSYAYALIAVDAAGTRETVGTIAATPADDLASPHSFALHQNYPNPFNPRTEIVFDLAERSDVTLRVFDLLGREVATLVQGTREAGHYSATFDAAALPSGIYLYRLDAGHFHDVKKMVLMK